jgi:hypothetical protein
MRIRGNYPNSPALTGDGIAQLKVAEQHLATALDIMVDVDPPVTDDHTSPLDDPFADVMRGHEKLSDLLEAARNVS